ncbi:MAG: SURF1 family protein [Sphingomonadaceae bacterium]|nr:SURF1 family protein [Sphingomonadaceae bacterium]
MKRIPVIPTLVVLVAAALMVKLGIWQLARAQWKEALLARYQAAATQPPIAYPLVPTGHDLLFRKAEGFCLQPTAWRVEPGRNLAGEMGWRHIAACRTGAEGPGISVDAGWSRDFAMKPAWSGGKVAGVIAPLPDHRSLIEAMSRRAPRQATMLVAATPAAGLQPSAPPSIADIPNNHRAYAVQWFVFAMLALIIYALALRRRLQGPR